ncbi:polysaccharide deacetylase family protein [Paraburkholderia sp. D15]|uniref:polysaccharide deacetylase family protein n=1 Tax=Paraburkholderia sp. D15 TaxID=2880218 RepID=UPI00247AD060|nr:polysaccharide deacetylase family protein [Paraburkholderia sp. D15]WGS50740.1 polysaccharide deacetylase family protein [Paraburkholderia sp. D15]
MKNISLTFDNGPDTSGTQHVLDVLTRHDIRATFFALGSRAVEPEGRAWLERVRDGGHCVGNHSFHHRVPLGEDRGQEAVEREIVQTEAALAPFTGGRKLFRPFGGGGRVGPHLLSAEAADYLVRERYTCVLWNCVPGDWLDEDGWVDKALAQCAASEWPVVVMHDSYPRAMRQLERFVCALKDGGYTFSQDWPLEVLPIVEGVAGAQLADITAPR